MVDTNKIRNTMRKRHVSQECLACFLGISSNTLRSKLSDNTHFNIVEAKKISEILGFSEQEILDIFFDNGVGIK